MQSKHSPDNMLGYCPNRCQYDKTASFHPIWNGLEAITKYQDNLGMDAFVIYVCVEGSCVKFPETYV